MGIPVAFSTSPKPAKRSHSVKLTPRTMRTESSSPVASAECEGTDEEGPVVVMLFADNTIRAYDTKSLDLARPVLDLGTNEPHTVICSVDDSFVVTGGGEGCLILSNVRTGRVSAAVQAHAGAVLSVDSWLDYVVSAGRDNMLKFFRFVDGELLSIARREVERNYVPLTVKFGFSDGLMMAIVTHETSSHIHLYPVDGGGCTSPYDPSDNACPAEYRLCGIAMNESRTLCAAAFKNNCCLQILIKDLNIFNVKAKDRVISTSCRGNLVPIVNWRAKDSGFWITNGDGTVNRVDVGGVREDIVLGDSKNAVGCLQVCRIGDREVLITGGRNGEITLWG